jgi:OmcA/MtrC family decaheme c-type cytochrome
MALLVSGCGGSDGDDGATGAAGPPGDDGSDGLHCWDLNENGVPDPEEDLNGDGEVNVLDCNATANAAIIPIGDGSELTEEQIERIGRLVAEITNVTIASPPVVDFTVVDSNGNPAVGIAEGVVWFTIAKLAPGDPNFNGGLAYWQSYVNRIETPTEGNPAGSPNVLDSALQANTDSAGTLEELGPGEYRYTFATDITDPDQTLGIVYEPYLTTRVGLEIRLDGEAEIPLAPFNPVHDFVPDGGNGTGVTKDIADTANCANCHYQFTLHGGPRKTVEYCVTCHNPGSIDQDTGESIDMAYLAHSVHPGRDRNVNGDRDDLIPYIVWGYGEQFGFGEHDYSEVTHPQSLTYCENCHEASEATPDGDAWNEAATAKTCGGCHADGLVVGEPDPVTGQPDQYFFDHTYADTNVGIANDGTCGGCHLGSITTAGPALKIHSTIAGDQRFAEELGSEFILSVTGATDTEPGDMPVVTYRVDKTDGSAWDIVNDPEFDGDNGAGLDLYLAWTTDDIYNGDENGNLVNRGQSLRMRLADLQAGSIQNADGSYTVTYNTALPTDYSGDIMLSLGGRPATLAADADGIEAYQRSAATAAVFYPDSVRQYQADSDGCNACHQQLQFHGTNRSGDTEMCLVCHDADFVGGNGSVAMSAMIHRIHTSPEITYPQSVGNCFSCHAEGGYNVARATARALSTDAGADSALWTDDLATTATSAACGTCHSSNAATGHFLTNGGQIDAVKGTDIVGGSEGLPLGQEACAVCHGAGSTFDTTLFHNTPET